MSRIDSGPVSAGVAALRGDSCTYDRGSREGWGVKQCLAAYGEVSADRHRCKDAASSGDRRLEVSEA
jgi:hypothetical protein